MNGILPDASGEITLTAASVGADPIGSAETVQTALTPTAVSLTLLTANWTGDSAPFIQTVADASVVASAHQLYSPAESSTIEQIAAWDKCGIFLKSWSAGTSTWWGINKKPEIDLVANVLIKGVTP